MQPVMICHFCVDFLRKGIICFRQSCTYLYTSLHPDVYGKLSRRYILIIMYYTDSLPKTFLHIKKTTKSNFNCFNFFYEMINSSYKNYRPLVFHGLIISVLLKKHFLYFNLLILKMFFFNYVFFFNYSHRNSTKI